MGSVKKSFSKTPLQILKNSGPAWVISAVACGPATLISVVRAGAGYGWSMLVVVALSVVFGTAAQLLATETGLRKGPVISAISKEFSPLFGWIITIVGLLATGLASSILLNTLVSLIGQVSGWKSPLWGVLIVALLMLGSNRKAYKFFEFVSKSVVVIVLLAFIGALIRCDWSNLASSGGFDIGAIFKNKEGALLSAAVMGGAVHITIIMMHSYNLKFKKWNMESRGMARMDTILSMGGGLGLYSLVLFLIALLTFHSNGDIPSKATEIAGLLEPVAGRFAGILFTVGLIGAAFSTYLPTVLAGTYFVSDIAKIPLDQKNTKFRIVLMIGFLFSLLGVLIPGKTMFLLPLMLACGLIGTPIILIALLFLAKSDKKPMISLPLFIINIISIGITGLLAFRFVWSLFKG